MALLQKGVALAAGRMPKMISPRVHSALDYAVAGSFLLMGALFWKRNRRAAIGSLLCGGATAAVSLLTDYPGGARKVDSLLDARADRHRTDRHDRRHAASW